MEQKPKDKEEHASLNEMKINQKKTKLMLFNTSTKYDFHPEMEVNGDVIEVVSKMKLLGVIVTDNLKWYENTSSITKKAFCQMWIIRRLKNMEQPLNIFITNK